MIINTLVAMCAGYVLNLMFGCFKGSLNYENSVKKFAKKLSKILKTTYGDSAEAQKMAGTVLVLLTLLVFAGIPLAILILGYKFFPVIGLVFDCFFCWQAFSIRNVRMNLGQISRSLKIKNLPRARKCLSNITSEDCSGLEEDEILKKSVESAADISADNGVGTLFFIMLAGGFGGLFYRSISIIKRTYVGNTNVVENFYHPTKTFWNILNFIPARLCGLTMRIELLFLNLDSKNATKIYRRDRKKVMSLNLGICRSIMAGALNIKLTNQEYKYLKTSKFGAIGDENQVCDATHVYWANQMMYGTVFIALLLFVVIRVILAIVI